jgi:hypothetical protein
MIKFFRNIRYKLLGESRFARYLVYATGEIILVVIGILIALQVNNANENRKNKSLEKEYMERIYSDLHKTTERLEVDLEWQRNNVNLGNIALTSLLNCSIQESDRDDIAKGLFNLGKFNPTLMVNTTLEELKTSGRLVLLKDKELVSKLIDLQRLFDTSTSQMTSITHFSVRPVNTIQSQIIYLNLNENSGIKQNIGWNDIQFDFESACKDEDFKAAISSLINYTHEMARRDSFLIETTQKVLEYMEKKESGLGKGETKTDTDND